MENEKLKNVDQNRKILSERTEGMIGTRRALRTFDLQSARSILLSAYFFYFFIILATF